MIAYPSQLDNFLKSQCAIKGSGHYMDDFYNLVPPNRNCREILSAMFAQAEKNKFTFNPDKTRYIHLDRPFRYCKTKYFLTESGHVVMRANRNILKLRRIFYSIFGFSCESIENFREKERRTEMQYVTIKHFKRRKVRRLINILPVIMRAKDFIAENYPTRLLKDLSRKILIRRKNAMNFGKKFGKTI